MSTDGVGNAMQRDKDDEQSMVRDEQSNGQKSNLESRAAQDEEKQQQKFKPVGFWDPSLKHVRKEAFTKWTLTSTWIDQNTWTNY